MNINYENTHCQIIGIFNGKVDKTPNAFSSPIVKYYKHYTI